VLPEFASQGALGEKPELLVAPGLVSWTLVRKSMAARNRATPAIPSDR
jgi:hypothetical protein